MALKDYSGLNRSLTAKIVFYMIFKPQSNCSCLYVNNVTLRSNRSLNRSLNRNLTAAAYVLTMVQTAAVCLGHNSFFVLFTQ